jgi:uncharacterized protein
MFNYTAFDGFNIISQGGIEEVALEVRQHLKLNRDTRLLIFSDFSGKQMDFDLSGSEKDILERLKIFKTPELTSSQSGPGRPKLGVVPREISLLPSHWEWLSTQPGGASSTIRRLVEEKLKLPPTGKDKSKQAQETVYTFLNAIAGDLPHFEEALRFLYRKDKKKFKEIISSWPADLLKHTMTLASDVFPAESK